MEKTFLEFDFNGRHYFLFQTEISNRVEGCCGASSPRADFLHFPTKEGIKKRIGSWDAIEVWRGVYKYAYDHYDELVENYGEW